MRHNPVITAVTDIAASPDEVWTKLTDFAGYAQWRPALRFVYVPSVILPGTRLRTQVTLGTENDGEYSFTILHYEAPQRLAWEGGIPEVLMGRHSFVLEPRAGGTRYTRIRGVLRHGRYGNRGIRPIRMEEDYASYGSALKESLESDH